jgi:SAM-dependent methyltransferase
MPAFAQQTRTQNPHHAPPLRYAGDAKTPLETPTVQQRAGYLITNPWRNYLLPVSVLQGLMARSNSPLIAEGQVRPGGWRSMEIMYRNDEPVDWPDRQALRDNPLSMASRNRRRIITRKLASLIADYAARSHVTVLGVGAGPGRHVQTALADSGVDPARVEAWLIDRDDDAFEYGRSLAAGLGIADSIHFLKGDACRIREVLPDVSAQIVKLVGLAEYLNDLQLVELLRALRGAMAPAGTLVTHGLVDAYGTGRFLARVWNLRHRKRSARSMTRLIESAGLRVTECVTEPAGIYPIVTAVRDE